MSEAPWNEYVRMPFTVGVYLAVNAIPDAYVVVDGPDCLFFKAEYVHGTQDLHSTLLDAASRHRVIHTVADTNNVVVDREDLVTDLLRRVASRPGVGAVFVTALPMAAITGSQYDRLARAVRTETGIPVLEVPAKSLQGDWLDGYAEVLAALASGVELDPPSPDTDGVALVGMLLDRTEADNLANVLELKRLLEEGLGLRLVSVWPSNQGVRRLARVGSARTIVSLPYARKAARILARRTGATLVEAEVPLGLRGTGDFLRAVAAATGREERVEAVIRAEEAACAPLLRRASDEVLRGRRIGLLGDPYLAPRVAELLDSLGASLQGYLSTRFPPEDGLDLPGPEVLAQGGVDLCLTTTLGLDLLGQRRIPYAEFGFPSYGRHALATAPSLGYRGALWLAEMLANHVVFFEDLRRFGLMSPPRSGLIGPAFV